jgi:hypothetical protein
MARSVLGWIGLVGTLIFALPAAMLGVEFIIRGRTAGGVALVVAAALMIGFERYITTPGDLTGMVADRTLGRLVETDDDGEKES